MFYMGIDQSLRSCAWVILDESANVFDFKIVSSNQNDDLFTRAHTISKELYYIANSHKVDAIAIEGLPFGMTRGNVTRDLAALQGIIITYFKFYNQLSYDITIVPPTSAKKFAGKGNFSKQEMIDALPVEVYDMFTAAGYKKSKGLSDLADAYWITRFII